MSEERKLPVELGEVNAEEAQGVLLVGIEGVRRLPIEEPPGQRDAYGGGVAGPEVRPNGIVGAALGDLAALLNDEVVADLKEPHPPPVGRKER